jgi:hypothetical protein
MKALRFAIAVGSVVLINLIPATNAVAESCNGPTRDKVGPNGKTVTLCLDGTRATCIRDGMRQGHSRQAATDFCNKNSRLR